MKIVHIEERFHPGTGYQCTYLAKYRNPNDELHFITSKSLSVWEKADTRDIFERQDKEFEEAYGVKIWRLDASWEVKNKYWVWISGLKRAVKEIDPDVIFLHGFEVLSAIRIILSGFPRKYLVVSDTHTLMNQRWNNIQFKIYDFFIRKVLSPCANFYNIPVFYTAEENKKILEEIYKIKKENVYSLLIGSSFDDYHFDENSRVSLRRKFAIDGQSRVIIYTGKFNMKKKPHLILNALSLIEKDIKEKIFVFFIGSKDDAYMEKYFRYSFGSNIEVINLDAVPSKELYKYYSMSDFAIFPAENTLSSLDAQACMLPVIMEEDFTNNERLKKGGLVYNKGDINDLGYKILKLLYDSALLQQLRSEGRDYVKNKYDYKKIISGYESFLESRLRKFGK